MTPRQKRVLAAILELELASENNQVTPRALWESARAPDHPLHNEFEWDDSVAAEAYRDEQARRLLRLRVTVVHEEKIIHAPICVRTPEASPGEQSYTRTVKIVDDKERSRQVLLEEVDRAARAVARAKEVAHALGLEGECDVLLAQLAALKQAAA